MKTIFDIDKVFVVNCRRWPKRGAGEVFPIGIFDSIEEARQGAKTHKSMWYGRAPWEEYEYDIHRVNLNVIAEKNPVIESI